MTQYQASAEFAMSAESLWKTLRNFGDVSWLPGSPQPQFEGTGVGMIRSVVIPPLPIAREQLDGIDEEARTIRYHVIDGMPFPVKNYKASMQEVHLDEGRCRLVWSCSFEADGISEEEACQAIRELYDGVLTHSRENLESRA